MAHDFAAQKAESAAVLGELSAKHDLPDIADVDYFLVPDTDGTDWEPLAEALTKAEFVCEFFSAQEDEDASYLMASLSDQPVTLTGIWIGEETATRIGLEHGFSPDGWGLTG